MTDKHFSRDLETMERLAQAFVETVRDSCERIQVAGSVRRKKPRPSDIEIVVEPAIGVVQADQLGLFGGVVESEHKVNLFDLKCDRLLDQGILEKRQNSLGRTAWGERTKLGILYLDGEWAPIDIFSVVEPASWGVILALRTGPGDFNKLLVNHAHTVNRKVAGGRVWNIAQHPHIIAGWPSSRFVKYAERQGVEMVPTPTEAVYFEALGVPCWLPEERTVQRLRQYLDR